MILLAAFAVALLAAAGTYLVLDRRAFRVVVGLALLTHAANLTVLAAGGWAPLAPIVRPAVDSGEMADPLPHALVLTAIVISLAMSLYLLAVFVATARRGGVELGAAPASDAGRAPEEVAAELGAGKAAGERG
ncbi:MAG: NADH-quinone oxidoreductase subunit K [Thermoanaerobaculia bacterium]|nr:NADH-quinone oxidoreductase subunit K [Thermoanaerobaculia bacterium]MCZ7652635.1 NADH-quinone oxidoreductase subunit K [Thermoanaerobaculia bacterium]